MVRPQAGAWQSANSQPAWRLAPPGGLPKPVTGEVPNPIWPPPGCAFHPRCPLMREECKLAVPEPRTTQAGMAACIAVEPVSA
ncbi:oligopeptide/dipeptide ABC transporter ATP-binding protein [Hoeflea sp.]|uniref:oligopeptide/dipeptide ABC transporter ATP-binding protein n=1 Tax=Hoeflea sp. TaxID=1940281 RepID=UPI00374A886E